MSASGREPIRVALVEDSPTARALVAGVIAGQPDMQLVGSAGDGVDGVALVRALEPDVVLMDANLPVLDGFLATRRIMEECPTRIVMVTASLDPADVRISMRGLEAGALAVIRKPSGPDSADHEISVRHLVETIRLMSEVSVVRRRPARDPRAVVPPAVTDAPCGPRRVVVMGTSTGGPRVLAQILRALPADFAAPICIVQHIAEGFLPGLVGWLREEAALSVAIAEDGCRPLPGAVYFAPDGRQLGFGAGGALRLSPCAAGDAFCPSVSHLFRSAAAVWGRTAVGVLLTGMGRDGVEGLSELRAAGAETIAQDPASCTVDGMPGAAIASGSAMRVLQPEAIATELRRLVAHGREDNARK
ncbi:MAG: chemotaxis protein CheB [Alphaproteobacteria bacterium]